MKTIYKLINQHVKATFLHPELGLLTFDSATTPESEYEFYYNNGFDCIFKRVKITPYKNIQHDGDSIPT